MTPRRLRPWQDARTLADLGELTAQWLEGAIAAQPSYHGPSDIEEPEMVPVLAGLCRTGYMTIQSQAGYSGPGDDGAHWEQRAAVDGFASGATASALARAARRARLAVITCGPSDRPRWHVRHATAVPVTCREGRVYSGFGSRLSRRHLRDPIAGYGSCHPLAVAALCDAWQVTVIDPEWGRADRLWDALEAVTRG